MCSWFSHTVSNYYGKSYGVKSVHHTMFVFVFAAAVCVCAKAVSVFGGGVYLFLLYSYLLPWGLCYL